MRGDEDEIDKRGLSEKQRQRRARSEGRREDDGRHAGMEEGQRQKNERVKKVETAAGSETMRRRRGGWEHREGKRRWGERSDKRRKGSTSDGGGAPKR